VAAQSPDNPGVLVLSQFAGSAQELKTTLTVNPYDIEATAAAIARAFAMPRWRCFARTASTTGRRISYRRSADTVKKVSMELSGNAPFIV
jgi:trehalose-6-phosphate synthase